MIQGSESLGTSREKHGSCMGRWAAWTLLAAAAAGFSIHAQETAPGETQRGAQQATVAPSSDPDRDADAIREALPGIEIVGIRLQDEPAQFFLAHEEDWRLGLYSLAAELVRTRRECEPLAGVRATEKFDWVATHQNRFLTTSQWRQLDSALPTEPVAQYADEGRCLLSMEAWTGFDDSVEAMKLGIAERVDFRAYEKTGGSTRPDRPTIAAGFAGIRIGELYVGGPAEQAGMRPGDEVRRIDGKPVATSEGVQLAVWRSRPGQCMQFEADRIGQGTVTRLTFPVRPKPFSQVDLSRTLESEGSVPLNNHTPAEAHLADASTAVEPCVRAPSPAPDKAKPG